jgi:phosphatidylglycerophosphate synthase
MKIWRIKFKASQEYILDVVADRITDACVLAVNFYTKDGTNLYVANIISAELLSEPIVQDGKK